MELTYSAQSTDFDPDKRYRNPEYFERPESGVSKVTVVGEWPTVVDAYKAADVEVVATKASKEKKSAKPETKELAGARAERLTDTE